MPGRKKEQSVAFICVLCPLPFVLRSEPHGEAPTNRSSARSPADPARPPGSLKNQPPRSGRPRSRAPRASIEARAPPRPRDQGGPPPEDASPPPSHQAPTRSAQSSAGAPPLPRRSPAPGPPPTSKDAPPFCPLVTPTAGMSSRGSPPAKQSPEAELSAEDRWGLDGRQRLKPPR